MQRYPVIKHRLDHVVQQLKRTLYGWTRGRGDRGALPPAGVQQSILEQRIRVKCAGLRQYVRIWVGCHLPHLADRVHEAVNHLLHDRDVGYGAGADTA